jgi:hypothetical protein
MVNSFYSNKRETTLSHCEEVKDRRSNLLFYAKNRDCRASLAMTRARSLDLPEVLNSKISLLLSGLVLLLFWQCASAPAVPTSETPKPAPVLLDYKNDSLGIQLTLPNIKGWESLVPSAPNPDNIVFRAIHVGQLLNCALSVEPLNGELEDYYILIREANRFDEMAAYEPVEKVLDTLNGSPCLRFVYKADVQTDTDRVNRYVFTNILMRQAEFNYWLEMTTLDEAYDRKTALTAQVFGGLRLIPITRP